MNDVANPPNASVYSKGGMTYRGDYDGRYAHIKRTAQRVER
jgi:hypothetical protein